MPLFELLRLAKAKLESSQEKKSSAPEDDVVELVWENGQISMQNQSIKSRNTQACSTLVPPNVQSNSSRTKEIGNGSDTRPLGGMNGIPMAVSSLEPGLSQDDDLVPWLNQPLDGSLQSDFFPDVSEVTVNEQENDVPNQTLFPFFHANNNSDQSLVNSLSVPSHNESSQHGRGTSQSSSSQSNLFQPPPPLYQRDSVMNLAAGNRTVCRESGRLTHDQEPVLPSNKPGLMNFSHFLRPAALAKANLQGLGITSTREMGSISTTSGSSNHMENLFVESDNRLKEGKSSHSPTKVLQTRVVSAQAPEIKVLDQSVASDPVKLVTAGSSFKDNEKGCLISGNSCRRDQQNEKAVEPAVQCSSVCSGNSLEGPSGGPSRSFKRPHSDIQDMDGQSEDVEEESTDARKTAPSRTGSGSKRSRSAEVHNLSERRRRDRINEKMRALQELIPNCNKVDKASMLDEAIEHIKSLQLQVQIMSMSSGYYMPPMMFPPALQPRHAAAHMPHYPAMVMGMSYGMSMPDMSCVSPKIPMVQVPSQFPASGLQPLAHPSVAMPRIPGGFFMSSSTTEINGSAVTDTNKAADPSKDSGCKDQKMNKALKSKQSSSCSNVPTKTCGSS